MKPVFADTSYYIALLNRSDEFHAKARALTVRGLRVVTSSWVILELGDALCEPRNRAGFRSLIRTLRNARETEIVPASEEFLARAIEFYEARPDQEWSLTDCTSFLIMRERGLSDVLASDHHFSQAGFNRLLV